ncbi:MAG TPA: histidine phosphatase family protein [Kofleriaceae bacterium]|jgi:probable phosphoglycerate mutase
MVTFSKGGILARPMRERELVLVRRAETDDHRLEDISDPEVLEVVGAGIMKSKSARSAPDLLGLRHTLEPVEPRFFRDVESIAETRASNRDRSPLRGRTDPPLSNRGRQQAAALAAWFDDPSPTMLVTSPRRRAVETGDPIARRHGVAMTIDPRLDDLDYGGWTGRDDVGLSGGWPALYEQYLRTPEHVVFPGGEAVTGAQERAWQIMMELSSIDRSERVVVITHEAILRLIVCRVLHVPLAKMHDMRFAPASTTGFRVRAGAPVVEWLDAPTDVGHAR